MHAPTLDKSRITEVNQKGDTYIQNVQMGGILLDIHAVITFWLLCQGLFSISPVEVNRPHSQSEISSFFPNLPKKIPNLKLKNKSYRPHVSLVAQRHLRLLPMYEVSM